MPDIDEKFCNERHEAENRRITDLENTVKRIFELLDKYKDRPTWVIAGIITFLASALGVTMTELIHKIK